MSILNLNNNSFFSPSRVGELDSFLDRINLLFGQGEKIFDLGAQSTAPFAPIFSAEEELLRFEKTLFPFLKSNKMPKGITFSIDTFRSDVFLEVYREIRKNHKEKDLEIIWNDVSGVLTEEIFSILKDSCPDIRYVLMHSGRSKKEDLYHNKVNKEESDITENIIYFFLKNIKKLRDEISLNDERLIVDYGYSFNKTIPQTQLLIRKTSNVTKRILKEAPGDYSFLFGLSQKTCLRGEYSKNIKKEDLPFYVEKADMFQFALLLKIINEMKEKNQMIFRLHHFHHFLFLKEYKTLFLDSDC
mgnify:CR=1 FL=1